MRARPAALMFLITLLLCEVNMIWASPVPAPAERREIQSKKIETFRNQRAFRYEQPPPRGTELWERIWLWLLRQADKLFSGRRATQVFDVMKWLLPAIILGYAVMRIYGMEHVAPWRKGRNSSLGQETDPAENIHAVDFDGGISTAESDGRYRDAVRLQYLKTLKLLTDTGRINWKPDKTNADYVAEVAGTSIDIEFSSLTYIYECVWYGELPVNGDAYTKIKPGFLGFREQLKS
jgi:hypothetical protein